MKKSARCASPGTLALAFASSSPIPRRRLRPSKDISASFTPRPFGTGKDSDTEFILSFARSRPSPSVRKIMLCACPVKTDASVLASPSEV